MDRPQRLARKQEDLTAERHGGRVTPASGSGHTVKNDVRNGEWSIEVKSTSGLGYRLNKDDLLKAERHALADGKRMAFLVAFVGRETPAKRYVLMTEDDHLEREQELERLRNFRYYGSET